MDRITANLPSRNFDTTVAFYGQLGFATQYRDEGWLILRRKKLEIEFFAHPKLDPFESWHSACIRVDDITALQTVWQALNLPDDPMGRSRDQRIIEDGGPVRFFTLIDCDGSLLRCIENGSLQ
ncbi:hypothetical protein H9Q16_02265 [Sulfitobacter sp. TSTF-M16]|uniref:Bleomycin resistance protein n=1 Tax=Sulfitobacter aestuariivivens TaxID=2766981 RepID=A0A927D1M0_9RHOB|nr:bleomycin resistance protein [Sulfitobacter aestuariivivens]MBD3662736.1 hypothetical protein [Sulfitobacter aestuariivivens]